MRRPLLALLAIALGLAAVFLTRAGCVSAAPDGDESQSIKPNQEGLFTLPGELPPIPQPVSQFSYEAKLNEEKFYLCIPPNYRGREAFGLLIFVSADDRMDVPPDWKPMLAKHKLLYIAPQNVGNAQQVSRRGGLSVVAIYKMMELYKIDAKRVYVTGFSGGAKVACFIAFFHPDLVCGAVPMCGAMSPAARGVNVFDCDPKLVEKAKANVGIALITGSNDFNHASILRTYNEALAPQKFRAKVFDVPGLGHQIAHARTVGAALDWLEQSDARRGSSNRETRAKAEAPKN